MKLSVIIPSCKDPVLQKTIDDIRENFRGEYEIIVVFDGYPQDITGEDVEMHNEERKGLRYTVNKGVSEASGNYLMKIDEHCRFDEGFDIKMLETIKDNWIVTAPQYKLNPETWELFDEPPVVYYRLAINQPDKIGGVEWISRRMSRKHLKIDETMVFQGSCWLMSRKHWDWLGGLSEEGYGEFAQESTELCLKTWLGGGKVMVNKNTWYAHKHRKFGRIVAPAKVQQGNKYSQDFWLNNRWDERIHDLNWLMKRFGLY